MVINTIMFKQILSCLPWERKHTTEKICKYYMYSKPFTQIFAQVRVKNTQKQRYMLAIFQTIQANSVRYSNHIPRGLLLTLHNVGQVYWFSQTSKKYSPAQFSWNNNIDGTFCIHWWNLLYTSKLIWYRTQIISYLLTTL